MLYVRSHIFYYNNLNNLHIRDIIEFWKQFQILINAKHIIDRSIYQVRQCLYYIREPYVVKQN